MKLEQQVTSLEISKRLKELGVKQESLFYWIGEWYDPNPPMRESAKRWYVELAGSIDPDEQTDTFSAFTVAELGEMLPERSTLGKRKSDYECYLFADYAKDKNQTITSHTYANTEADARGKMLIYLLENNLLTL